MSPTLYLIISCPKSSAPSTLSWSRDVTERGRWVAVLGRLPLIMWHPPEECWSCFLHYLEGKKEAFSLLRLSLSICANGKHAQGLLDISPPPALATTPTHPPKHTHAILASPPPLQQIAVVTVWLDHQSWPLTAVFLSTWTGRSQLALSYRCPHDPELCVCLYVRVLKYACRHTHAHVAIFFLFAKAAL